MIMAMLDFLLLQYNSFSFVYHQSVFRIFKVFKSLRALRAIRVLRRLRSAGPWLSPHPHPRVRGPRRKGFPGLGSRGLCCDPFTALWAASAPGTRPGPADPPAPVNFAHSFLTSLQEVTGTLVRSLPSITAILILMFTCLCILHWGGGGGVGGGWEPGAWFGPEQPVLFSVVLRALFRHSDPKRFQSILSTIFTLFTLLTLDDWSLIYLDSRAQGGTGPRRGGGRGLGWVGRP